MTCYSNWFCAVEILFRKKNIYSNYEETCGFFLEVRSTFHHMPYRIQFQSNPRLHNLFV